MTIKRLEWCDEINGNILLHFTKRSTLMYAQLYFSAITETFSYKGK